MITQAETHFNYCVYHSLDNASVSPDAWNELVVKTNGQVFMTWHYQKIWWDVFGRGKLLIIVAFEEGKPKAIAPLFADGNMIYFVGSGGSDYLHFIGDFSDKNILKQMLLLAIREVPNFVGFLFYHVPTALNVCSALKSVSDDFSFNFYIEDEQVAPALSIAESPEVALNAVTKKSLVRHEKWFIQNGSLAILQLRKSKEILVWLETFFEQHRQRWAVTAFPSLFNQTNQCIFFTKLAETADDANWVRFMVVLFNNVPVAFHFGFFYNQRFLWYKPSFDIGLAKHSPGEVLLKNLLMNAIETKTVLFDFGLGDEAFKQRFATHHFRVQNIGMYPSKSI